MNDKHGFKNRITEMITVPASEIMDHEGNPWVHPEFQSQATKGSLQEVGIVQPLVAYRSARNKGKLTLLDGHDRKAIHPQQVWPVVVVDLTDEEADLQITLHNTTATWVVPDALKMANLVERAKSQNAAVIAAHSRLMDSIREQVEIAKRAAGEGDAPEKPKKNFDFLDLGATVKVVITATDLPIVERALSATGIRRRGTALTEICQFYLDNASQEES